MQVMLKKQKRFYKDGMKKRWVNYQVRDFYIYFYSLSFFFFFYSLKIFFFFKRKYEKKKHFSLNSESRLTDEKKKKKKNVVTDEFDLYISIYLLGNTLV